MDREQGRQDQRRRTAERGLERLGVALQAAGQRARQAEGQQRALVQTYTRLNLLPPQADGSETAIIASFETRDVRLAETLPADEVPENARLRVDLYDRSLGEAIGTVCCNDLQEAEPAPIALMDDAEARLRTCSNRKA
ncbi:hypothetical protein [Methylobacterium soli]|uniref:hypothetical protein n=1 Tax=Methylobacterium soli TaxID=553447 RepID=UPI00177B442A|nr:hypothetical protein [Methylobacterium soli]